MKVAAFCLCSIAILTLPGVLAQQTGAPNQSWDALRQLQAGEKLEVEKKTGKRRFQGSLSACQTRNWLSCARERTRASAAMK